MPKDCLFDGNCKWLRQIRRHYMFLLNMERPHPLSYLQATSVPKRVNWHLTKPPDGILLGSFGTNSAFYTSVEKHVTCLFPNLLKNEYLVAETSKTASTFSNCLVIVHVEFPCQDFRPFG